MLFHSTTQIPFFCNNLYTYQFGFSIQMQQFYFHENYKDILQLLDIVENHCIWKCHVTVNVQQYYYNNRNEKCMTRTHENPHLCSRVWVSAGMGMGWPGRPQGYPCYSLVMGASESWDHVIDLNFKFVRLTKASTARHSRLTPQNESNWWSESQHDWNFLPCSYSIQCYPQIMLL